MGLIKFKLPLTSWSEDDVRQAYVLGPDLSPTPCDASLRGSELIIRRSAVESGRVVVPWRVEGRGRVLLNTATLPERFEAYDLLVELARGTLNDVQNQLFAWQDQIQMPPELNQLMARARRHFAQAATSRDTATLAQESASRALRDALEAGRILTQTYTSQVLQARRSAGPGLGTRLAVHLDTSSRPHPWWARIPEGFNAVRLEAGWRTVAPEAGQFRWEVIDSQLHWARKRHLKISAGPLIDLRYGALPDWLWLWQGDYEEISSQAIDYVRHTLARYRGRIPTWHLVARPGSNAILDLSEEDQVRLTARLVQVARTVEPDARLIVDFDRPWGDWMASGEFQLGPLHLADALARADLGLSGIGLEIVPGFVPWGSPLRELFEFSRLLDLYARIDLPLHISLAFPSHVAESPSRDLSRIDLRQWPSTPTPELQRDWTEHWLGLAVAKPFVHTVCWVEACDAAPRLFPGCGLFRGDGSPQPAFDWICAFRKAMLSR
ncbi:MAG: hypothetical protein KatS3mg108_1343 [Isosphaeraceae bacterium]|jgi:hypothetical protein|nr:MAG: hypothetical protein KatS3mg108_1343 [Isosphaeraceae bacterium]